ncbi:SpaA isopeptide-forming pilin-related protein [Carnobacterium gallinarum]|uniref:SpaA isopeptide-forming pilin-related protein n=1 Tax=Carnobacterium gallinarum TaxID=2749 RepID=UPI0005573270|nr:SpaA isopeptide-forming pilin-related protein [Carnobacterium gallinarum]
MNKLRYKATTLLGLLTVLVAFFITPITTLAATVNYDRVTNHISIWYVNGVHWTDYGILAITADNQPAFCIEHGVGLNGGTGFTPSELSIAEKERLSLISYYGYQVNPTIENYGITQAIIWQELGDTLVSTTLPDFDKRKDEIVTQVNNHSIKPTFNNQTVTLNVGDSITLNDTNGVLSKYVNQLSNTANLIVEKNGNQLKLTATKDSKESGTVQFSLLHADDIGQSFVYTKPSEQKVATFKVSADSTFNVNVNVNLNGNVQVQKLDSDTNAPIADTLLKFEYNGVEKELKTDTNGLATVSDLKAGTKVKISEIQASDGYVNSNLTQEITVEPNQTVQVILNNKPQRGQLSLAKTGKKVVGIEKSLSEYGDLYQFKFDYLALGGVTYDIQVAEDIYLGSILHATKGDIVATVVTDDVGNIVDMPLLYLGKYEAIEKSAPAGFIVDNTPIPFEFTYQGQTVELVSESLSATNEFQTLTLNLYKDEEIVTGWKDNEPLVVTIKSKDKVFGLFSSEEQTFTDTKIPQDSLLAIETVADGILTIDNLQYPEGNYYFMELDSGVNHKLDLTKYEFDFTAEDNNAIKEINIYDEIETETPILNKLHFNEFHIKKLNETATLKELQGYSFDFSALGTGAIFTLEDKESKILQEVTIDADGIGNFSNIPVGTFFLKEKSTSSNAHVLLDSLFRIESTKEGIQIFDTKDILLGETQNNDSILLNLNNSLITGNVELTKKDVSTGKLLPNTKVKILDNEKKTIIEGITDENGIFTFENLPKGIYFFQEYEAPQGYELDETPMQFEIKEDGKVVKCEMTNEKIKEDKLPHTGETNNFVLYAIGALLCVSAVAMLGIKRYKKMK